MRELEQLLGAEREQNALHEQRSTELSTFLDEHRRLKCGWREALAECNDKYEAQCHEAARLQVENRQLRVRVERAERRQQQQQQSRQNFGSSGGGSGDQRGAEASGTATTPSGANVDVDDGSAHPPQCYRIGRGNNVMFVTAGGGGGSAWGDGGDHYKD